MSIETIVREFRELHPSSIVTDVRADGEVFQVVFWSPASEGFQEATATPVAGGTFEFATA